MADGLKTITQRSCLCGTHQDRRQHIRQYSYVRLEAEIEVQGKVYRETDQRRKGSIQGLDGIDSALKVDLSPSMVNKKSLM